MYNQIDLEEMIRSAMPYVHTVIVRNKFGTAGVKGADLAIKSSEKWITIYRSSGETSEQLSHVHLRKSGLKYATIYEPEDLTAQIQCWVGTEGDGEKAPVAFIFKPFFDWNNTGDGKGKKALLENQTLFQEWKEFHGERFPVSFNS